MNRPLAASYPKLRSSCSSSLPSTRAPSPPAFETIVNVGAYNKTYPLLRNISLQNVTVGRNNELEIPISDTLRAFWIIWTPLFWSSFEV